MSPRSTRSPVRASAGKRHAAHIAALRMAAQAILERTEHIGDPVEKHEMLKLAQKIKKNYDQLEREDLRNKTAQETWDGLSTEDRVEYTYPDRAVKSWAELNSWERPGLIEDMVKLYKKRQSVSSLNRA